MNIRLMYITTMVTTLQSPNNVKFPDNSLKVYGTRHIKRSHIMPVNACTETNIQ